MIRLPRLPAFPGRSLALLVAAAYFMEELDGTVIATAAPRMAAALHTAPAAVSVTVTAYLVALAAAIPVSGWITGRLGPRRVFCAALVVFTGASALCAAAATLPELTAARVAQGIGGAMMVPVGRSVVLRATDRADLFAAVACLTWPGLLAPVAAPVLGGALAAYASWRWIFLVNVPIGLVLLALAVRMVPAAGPDTGRRRLDRTGLLLTAAGLAAAVLGCQRLGGGGPPALPVAELVLSGAVLAVAVRHMRRVREPLLGLDALRVPTFRTVATGGSVYRAAVTAAPFLLPLMFQSAFGWGPLRAGAMVIAVFAGNVGVKPFTTRLMRAFGFRPVLLVSTAGLALTFACCAAFTVRWWPPALLLVLLASGVFRSTGYTAYNTLQFADVPAPGVPDASALASTLQQLAGGLGVALAAVLLRLASGAAGPATTPAPYHAAFGALAVAAVVSALPALRLARDAGAVARPARA